MEYKYEIGGKIYFQKPLVLGQVRQLMNLLQGVAIPRESNAAELIIVLGDRLPAAVAIVLHPEGIKLKDKALDALTREIEFEISPEDTIKVVEDFFGCNPISLVLEKVNKAIGQMKERTGLPNLPVSSAKETLQKETTSSGDTPSENASLT